MRFRILLLIILSLGLFSFYALPVAAQATITVVTIADATSLDGNCSFREAVENANNNAATHADCVAGTGTDTIAFNIAGPGPHTIAIQPGFPDITAPVIIDGLTQPGSNCSTGLRIILNGAGDPSGWGIPLRTGASGSTVRGLVIQGFSTGVGINLLPSDNNIIQCNFIGTDATGTSAVANFTAIFLANGSENNLIGTNGDGVDDALEGNILSGNSDFGISMNGALTTGNRIAGNKIGTDHTGSLALGNGRQGITLASGANLNIIGVDGNGSAGEANEGNLISGNSNYGILFQLGAPNNRVAGNRIGTNLAGTGAIPNGIHGILIQDDSNGNVIGTNGDGASDALEGNLISGNTSTGISITYFSFGSTHSSNNVIAGNLIGTDITGTLDLGNGTDGVFISTIDTRVGTDGNGTSDTLERNIISGNGNSGIEINGVTASGNVVAGNHIGTNSAGTGTIANTSHGIELTNGANANIIGTNGNGSAGDANEGNLISGNTLVGVYLTGASVTNNRIAGNRIGTDITGTLDLGNGNAGVLSQGSANSSIIGTNGDGTSDALEGNLISGNNTGGIILADSDNNRVAGNLIGTNLAGTTAIANNLGISIQNTATGNIIGTNGNGVADGLEGNTISGNTSLGLAIANDSPSNVVTGNRIGTNLAGTAAIANGTVGISVAGASNRIGTDNNGTSDALEGNTISGNNSHGITISGATAQNNTVAGNIIGLDSTASASLANNGSGITIENSASNNTIGGTADVQSNFIGGNSARGIFVTGANSSNNTINNNYIGTNATQTSLPNGTNGIEINATGSGLTTVSNNWIFYHPTTGILLGNAADLGAAGVSEQNCFYQNAAGVNNTTGIDTFFENNWWGVASGPSGVGAGNGDSVSANVDYQAFLTTAPSGCPGIARVIIDPLALSAAEGGALSYTIVLDSQPAAGEVVTITIAISGAAAGEIASTLPSLSFDFNDINWNTPQQFDITLTNDFITNGNRSYTAAFTHSSDSSDAASGYDAAAALVIDSVDLDVIDNESPNVVINPTVFNLRTGASRTYDVSLTLEPASDVTITLSQLDANCTISPTTLTFTNSAGASPWNVPQSVTVTGVGTSGSICTIQHTPTGGGYDAVLASDVVVNLRRGVAPSSPSTGTGGAPEIAVFDPAISKLGTLFPGQTGIVGEELEWIVTVSNVGTVAGVNVTVTDTLIAALQVNSVDAPGGTVTINGQTVTVVYPSLAVGQTVQFSIFTTVLSGVTVDNTACVNASNQAAPECVSATSGAVSQLPSTGESPLWRYALLAGIALMSLTLFAYQYQKLKTEA